MDAVDPKFQTQKSNFLSVGIEEGEDGGALVHSFGVPGCVAQGATPQEALEAFAVLLSEWLSFRESVGSPVPSRDAELEITVDEWISSDAAVAAGVSEACFEHDLEPLDDAEISAQLHTLGDLRGLLLRALRGIPRAELENISAGELSLHRILDELARAQWWTLTRLGASPLAEIPQHPIARLDTAMALVVQQFTGMVRGARDTLVELDGETWTPRKVLRRLLWLEWSLGQHALDTLLAEGAQ